jgi:hypothetical protein
MKRIAQLLLLGFFLSFSLGPANLLASLWPHRGHHYGQHQWNAKNLHRDHSQIKHAKKPKGHAGHRPSKHPTH